MAAILAELPAIGEILAGADALIAESPAGAVLGESAATNGTISALASEAKSNINPAIDAVFGQGAAQSVENKLSSAYESASNFLKDLESGSIFGTTYKQKQEKANPNYDPTKYGRRTGGGSIGMTGQSAGSIHSTYQPSIQDQINTNKNLVQKFGQTDTNCACSSAESGQGTQGAHGASMNSNNVSNLVGPSYTNAPVTIVGSNIDVTQDIYSNGNYLSSDGAKIQIITDKSIIPTLEKIQTNTSPLNPVLINNQLPLGRETGQRLGEFIIKANFAAVDSNDHNAISNVIINNPHLIEVSKQYLSFVNELPAAQVPAFQKISQVYHGRNVNLKDAFINEQGLFSVKDELGNIETYRGRSAPVGSSVFYLLANDFLPTPPGYIWMGPKSPNNGLPTNLLDLFSMMHDIEYDENGWFHQEGDLKYISRLIHNMDRFTWAQRQLAEFAVKWFSTAGFALAQIKGSLPSDIDKVETKQQTNGQAQDIYSYISKQSSTDLIIRSDFDKNSTMNTVQINPQLRKEFYAGLRDSVDKMWTEKCPVQVGSDGNAVIPESVRSLRIVNLF